MPSVNWTEAEKKEFWRNARSAFWTFLIVLALIFFFKIAEPPKWLGVWIFLLYFVALFVPVFKLVKTRWGR